MQGVRLSNCHCEEAKGRRSNLLRLLRPLCGLAMTLLCFSTPLAFAESSAKMVNKANKLYKAEEYDEALRLYNESLIERPDSAQINYNIGAAQFKKGDFEKAKGAFEKALVTEDKSLEAKANYNIGNSKYALGKLKENTDLAQTVSLLRQSLDYYKRAIELNPKDEGAKLNHELVEKELKVLPDKLKQQGQKQEKQDKDKQQGEQKKEEQSQGQKQEGKQEQQGEESKEGEAGEDKEMQSGQEGEPQELSKEQAEMLLDGFRQEENVGELRDTGRGRQGEVAKDW